MNVPVQEEEEGGPRHYTACLLKTLARRPRVKIRVEKNGFEASDNAAAPKREEKSLRWHSKKVVLYLGMNGGAGQPGAHQLHSPLCVQRAASWAANQALWNGPRTHIEQLRGSRGGIITRRRWKSTRAFLTV